MSLVRSILCWLGWHKWDYSNEDYLRFYHQPCNGGQAVRICSRCLKGQAWYTDKHEVIRGRWISGVTKQGG